MAAAAVPALVKAAPYIASGVGSLIGKKMSKPTKPQQQAIATTSASQQQLSGAAAPLLEQGKQTATQGAGYLGDAGRYYQGILGNRSQATASLAPEMNTALEFYRGAGNKARRTLTGGVRDQAVAELDRQKVGQLAGMLPAARRAAAEGLTDVGGTAMSGGTALTGQGAGLYDTAARIGASQFDQATKLREQEQAGGKSWGGAIFDIVRSIPAGGKGGKGGKGILPSSSISPGLLMSGPGRVG